jgi:two-component system, LytTR family, response regulator
MKSLTLTRSFYKNPQNGLIFLLVVVLFCEIIGWATSPQTRLQMYSSHQTLLAYLKNLLIGLLAPELCTLYILAFLIDTFHRFLGIRQINFNTLSVLKYEVKFLPLFLVSFFLFFPFTLHVRFLLREFPNYSLSRYLDLYILHGFTIQTYLLYLPFVVLLGYILINVSLVKDFLESNAQNNSFKEPIEAPKNAVPASISSINNPTPSLLEILPTLQTPTTNIPEKSPTLPEPVQLLTESTENYLSFIEAKTSTGEIFLRVEECYFFETVEERYYVEHLKGRFQISKPLSLLEEELEPLHFFRGNRSYIINLNYLDSYVYWEKGKYLLSMRTSSGMRQLAMPRIRFDAFRKALTNNRSTPKQLIKY